MTEQSLEAVFEELDEVVQKLEGEDVSLEESFQLYHTGMDLLKVCITHRTDVNRIVCIINICCCLCIY